MNTQDIHDEILRMFRSGASLRKLFIVAANFRRAEIEQKLYADFDGTIQDGIFKGIKLSKCSHDSTLLPKLLGTYEVEIADHVKSLASNYSLFIDVGCADGYYTSGIAVNANIDKVVGIDISDEALDLAEESALKNKVGQKCIFEKELMNALPHITNRCFVMIDVDGDEVAVLKALASHIQEQELREIQLIVETDFGFDGRSNKEELVEEIKNLGFLIDEIIDYDAFSALRPSPITKQLYPSYLDQMICLLERGYSNQSWIVARTIQR